jgi:hypothetical protein
MVFGVATVFALAFTVVTTAPAQQSSNRTGSSGMSPFGQRTLGGGSLQPGGTSIFGSSGSSNAMGSATAGATTQELQTTTLTGNERFMRGGRDAASSFVGADISEVRGVGSATQGAAQGLQGMQARQRNQAAFNQFRQFDQLREQLQNMNNFGRNNRTQVRIGLTLGFAPPPAAATVSTAAMGLRLTQLPGLSLVGNPQVMLEGRTAVVRGTAASEQDREMVSRLLLLEPGISSVRNEMTLAQETADPGSLLGSPPAGQPEPPPAPPRS